jgi:hypothetical protein
MWEDEAKTYPTIRFSEATGGKRIREEEAQMMRHDKWHLANTGE